MMRFPVADLLDEQECAVRSAQVLSIKPPEGDGDLPANIAICGEGFTPDLRSSADRVCTAARDGRPAGPRLFADGAFGRSAAGLSIPTL
jgi:hypothetical protein